MFIQIIEKFIINDSFYIDSDYNFIRIYRWNPVLSLNPWFTIFPLKKQELKFMLLDSLLQIKSKQDSSLVFRRSCREGICGSCAMNINGLNSLACLKKTKSFFIKNQFLTIYPLPHMFVIKDLIIDLTNFYNQYKFIKPWLIFNKGFMNKFEFIQNKIDRLKLDGLYECILCACCSSSCPSYWWNYDKYLGPAILLQTYRWINDSRDIYHNFRIKTLLTKIRISKCHSILNCVKVCPKNLNPGQAINILKYISK